MRVGMDARLVARGLGIATFVSELSEALCRIENIDMVWLGKAARAPQRAEAVEAPANWPFPALDLAPGHRLARRLGLDVIHFAANTGWIAEGPAPVVLTVHDLIFFEPSMQRALRQRVGHRYLRWVVPRAVASATALSAISATTADEVAERFGRRASVIPHGIRIPRLDQTAARREVPYLVAFGARDPRKGAELALEVLRRCRPTVPRLEFIARAGLPPGLVENAAPELADGSVVVHAGLAREELDLLLAGASALVYLSRSEGFGLPVLEAMACGTPVITGLAPATREVGGDAALYVDPAEPVASAAAFVHRLSSDTAFRDRTAAAGLSRARRRSWDEVAARYARLYAEAVG